MKKTIPLFLNLFAVSITPIAFGQEIPLAQDISPVRGFPTGEEVLNKTAVPYQQVEPHLEYKANGFTSDLMSKVPPPGIHPRVDFSPEDIPVIRHNIQHVASAKRAWERLVVDRASDSKTKEIRDPAQGKELAAISLYALIMDDQELGAKLGPAIVEWAAKVEEKIDEADQTSAYPQHIWFHIRRSGVIDLARAYDWAYNFMNDEQRSAIRKVISKGTTGRYNHGMELPRAFRTWNWPQFSQVFVNTALAIEGEEGYDPRIWEVCSEAVVDFLTYKISPEGWDFEATGYNGLAWGGGGVQALHAVARRLTPNPLMHPHLQAQTAAYIGQQGGVNGPWFGRGDSGAAAPQVELTHLMTAAYPNDPRWKMLWRNSIEEEGLGTSERRLRARKSYGIPFYLYAVEDSDPVDYWGADKNYPLTYEASSRGYMATRSSWDPTESTHMSFANYTKLRDTGHDGPDAGTFSIWSHGVDWSRNGDKGHKQSAWRAYVAIDGGGMEYGTAHGLFRPVVDQPSATSGRGDMTYSFTWDLKNGRYNVLYSPMFEEDPSNYLNVWAHKNVKGLRETEPDPTLFSKEFWSLASTNYGLWNGEDRHPTRRGLNKPVQRAFRSATLIRGDKSLNEGHGYSYVLTIDDIQQDEHTRQYEWLMPIAGANEMLGNRPKDNEIIVRRAKDFDDTSREPKVGDPLLMVRILDRKGVFHHRMVLDNGETGPFSVQRIMASSVSKAPDFKVLIYPHRHGDPLPVTTWNTSKTKLTVQIGDQVDVIEFGKAHVDRRPFGGHGEETYFQVTRAGEPLITVGGPPSLPRFTTEEGDFAGSMTVAFEKGQPGETIHYTLDGSEPTPDSTLYTGPFTISDTTTVRAITYSPNWIYGDKNSDAYREMTNTGFITNTPATYRPLVETINPKASVPVQATYTRVQLAKAQAESSEVASGVELKLYELPITFWRGSAIDLKSPLMPADLSAETPIFHTYQKTLEVPRIKPTVEEREMYQGVYVFSGFYKADVAGRYAFAMKSCGPTRLTVAGKQLVDIPGPYHVRMAERSGEVLLEKGLHRFEAIFTDPTFFMSPKMQVVDFGLSVKSPSDPVPVAVSSDALFRDNDLNFSIPGTILEVGQDLVIDNQGQGKLEVSFDGGKNFKAYTGAISFDREQSVDLVVRRRGESEAIQKTLNVIRRLPAMTEVPPVSSGMIRRRFLRDVKANFTIHANHNENCGHQVIHHAKPEGEDLFAFIKDATPEEVVFCDEMILDETGGMVRHYSGYWWAPETATYLYTLPNKGSNKLMIDDVHIASNHNLNARPEGHVLLESGWHKFEVMYADSMPGITVEGPGGRRDLQVSDFFRPTQVNLKPYGLDKTGQPNSFLLGSLFNASGVQEDIRMKSQIYGATPVADAQHPGAHRMSGDKSMVLVKEMSQASKSITLSMWIKPDSLKGRQSLFNRQNTGWVYSQRGGINLGLWDDRLQLHAYGWFGHKKNNKAPKLRAGEWQHIAFTMESKPGNVIFELWVNGVKQERKTHNKDYDIHTFFVELLGNISREKVNLSETMELTYEQALEQDLVNQSYKGLIADLRLYDTVLPDEAIRKMARKSKP